MTTAELCARLSLEPLCLAEPDRPVTGGYAGDLLSWVMGRAQSGDAWVTIMTNRNVVAVASMADVACIVLAEGVEPDADTLEAAQKQGVNLLRGESGAFALCAAIAAALAE